MKGTPLGGAFSYISGRYKEYPRGVHGCIPNDLLYEAPKSQHNLQVDLKVTVMLNYWNQFRKSYTEMLSTISLSPVGRGGGGGRGCTHATRKTANGDAIYGDRSFRQRVVTFAYVLLSRLP